MIGHHCSNSARQCCGVGATANAEEGVLRVFTRRVLLSMRALQRLFRLLALLAAIAVPTALFYGGAQPYAIGLIPPPWDKFAHLTVFAVLAAAIGYASGLRGARMWWLAFAGAVLVGAADEWHQASLPGRAAGWDDLAADAIGAALGATAPWRWRQRVHRWLEEDVVSRH